MKKNFSKKILILLKKEIRLLAILIEKKEQIIVLV